MSKDKRTRVIDAAEAALIELNKVARQIIDLSELDPEKAKTAASAKKLAVFDAFEIIDRIEDERARLKEFEENKKKKKTDTFLGVESRVGDGI